MNSTDKTVAIGMVIFFIATIFWDGFAVWKNQIELECTEKNSVIECKCLLVDEKYCFTPPTKQ